jgi:hypothetical protein
MKKYIGAWLVASFSGVVFGLGLCRAAARADAAMAQQTLPIPITPSKRVRRIPAIELILNRSSTPRKGVN